MEGALLYETTTATPSVSTMIILVVLVAITIILITPWQDFINNLIYRTFGVKKESTIHTFITAIIVTIVSVIALVFLVKRLKVSAPKKG